MGDNITTSLAFIYMYFNVFPSKFFLNSKGVNDQILCLDGTETTEPDEILAISYLW